MTKTKRVTVTELSEIGKVSRSAIYKAASAKKLTFSNGRADPLALAREWARKRDASQEDKIGPAIERVIATFHLGKSAETLKRIEEIGGDAGGESYASVRTRREAIRAEMAALDLAVRKGSLLETSEVTAAWTGMIAACRGQLLQLGASVANQVASERSPLECQKIIDRRIYAALEILADPTYGKEAVSAENGGTTDVRP